MSDTVEQIIPNRDELAKALKEKRDKEQAQTTALVKSGGELPAEATENMAVPYYGAGTINLSAGQRKTLTDYFEPEEHDILPTGEVYVAQVAYRRRLLEVFGPGGWALVPLGEIRTSGNSIGRSYQLIGWGRFLAEAMGEAEFQPENTRVSKFTATEIVKSNALVRCCKDLGMGSECWDRRWTEDWKAKFCEFSTHDPNKPNWKHWRVKKGAFAKA